MGDVYMKIKNKDVIKTVGTRNLAKILNCSESTINNWTKKGLGKRQEKMSTFNDIACNKVNYFKLDTVRLFLIENKKDKYLNELDEYLEQDYKCRLCCCNVATMKSIDANEFICCECATRYGYEY